ncbi:MAG TPA: hypothetical protein VHU84_05545 [Lacipirellulaceae bacterium]|nr:hypothetical protein [Lacipirellulaceae bacterium]
MTVVASTLNAAVKCLCRPTLWYVAAWLAIAGSGCDRNPTRVPVSGTVLIDGAPLKQGNIKFVPKDGRPSTGKISDGRFTLTCYDGNDGALLGTHRVQVASNRIISDSKIEWYAPPKYADFRTADISVEVTRPVDDLKIELTWGDRKGPYIQGR